MDEEKKVGREVKCGYCGCAFIPEPLTERDGEIEYTFFRCDFCGKAYMVSVTDEELRKNIAEYVRLKEQNRADRLSEPEQFWIQRIKAENAKRAEALRKLCLKGISYDGK